MTTPLRRPFPQLAALASLCLAGGAAAQIVTVGPPGSGAMFDEIQDGINAAPLGGIVMVAAGDYVDTRTLTINRGLTLLGAGSSSTRYTTVPSAPLTAVLPVFVSAVPAGQQVVVIGLEVRAQLATTLAPSAVVIADCVGTVVLADVRGIGSTSTLLQSPALVQVRDSAAVSIDGSEFAVGGSVGTVPAPALRVERSLVQVNDSRIAGASAPAAFSGGSAYDGSPALVALDAVVRIARSEVTGGNGAQLDLFSTPSVATAGGAAVRANNSQVLLRGGAGNELRGGRGGTGRQNGVTLSGPGGPALELDPTSLGATTPDSVVLAGLDGNQQANTPAVVGPGVFAPLTFTLATTAVTPRLVPVGSAFTINVGGDAGAIGAAFIGFAQVAPFAVPGVLGVAVLDLTDLVLLPFVVLDANGAAGIATPVPPNPALVGLVAHVQALTVDAAGVASLSAPSTIAVR